MNSTFTVNLARPGKQQLTFEARSLRLPAHQGSLGIMANRQAMLTAMEPGIINIVDITDRQILFATTGGFCEMSNNVATLLCDSLISVDDLAGEPPIAPGPAYLREVTSISETDKRRYVVSLLKKALGR